MRFIIMVSNEHAQSFLIISSNSNFKKMIF